MDGENNIDPMEVILKNGKDFAIKEGYTPTGRKVGVGLVANTSLYRLQYIDNKPGKLPTPYDGMYTKSTLAAEDLNKYLTEFWAMSDSQTEKLERKRYAEKIVAREIRDAIPAGQ